MNVYESVTERIIAQLENGEIPWRKEWKSTGKQGLPYNHITGKAYRGINTLLLMASGFSDARWMTFKQAQELGGHVRKGEHGTKIVFWSLFDPKNKNEEPDEKRIPFMREYTVFNYSQIDGLAADLPFDAPTFEPIPAAQALVNDYLTRAGIELRHGGEQAYYSPRLDYIQMPKETDFVSPDSYYSTLFHEAGHSTGHKSRLDRFSEKDNSFGSEDYSREELVAEFTAAFLCAQVGINNERVETNHAAYIQSWIKALKNDSKMLVMGAQRAQKAADYIQGKTFAAAEPEAAAA